MSKIPKDLRVVPELPKGHAPKRQVFIGVPTTNNQINIGVQRFLAQADRYSIDETIPWLFHWQIINGYRPVEFARNILVGIFLHQTEAEKLWFCDHDMMPESSAFELLDVDADIVAGKAWAFDHGEKKENGRKPGLKMTVYNYNEFNDYKFNPLIPRDSDQVVDCDAAGTATMLISRQVLEDPRMWLPDEYTGLDGETYRLQDETTNSRWAPPIFRTLYKPNGQILRGEDLDFCYRAKQLGYQIKAHVGAEFGHFKDVNLDHVAAMASNIVDAVKAGKKGKVNIRRFPKRFKPKSFGADLQVVK